MTPALPASLAAAALAAVAVAAWLPPGRVRMAISEPAPESAPRELLLRLRPALTGLVLPAGWVFVGGPLGVLAGLAAAVVAWRVLGNTESASLRMRRENLRRDIPLAIDLLGSSLAAGAALEPALVTVADAVGGPLAEELRLIGHRLSLGVDPLTVWHQVSHHEQLGPLGRVVARSHESGASIAPAIALLAAELRAGSRAEVEARARSVEVKAAAPLGACFLPAFLLLGVVPLVAGVFSSMQLFK